VHAGAEVTPSDPSTGFSRTTNKGADSVYNFLDLPLGTFKIRVTHAGFKASEKVGIMVHVLGWLCLPQPRSIVGLGDGAYTTRRGKS
jgi:hypothetical protein